MKTKTKTKRSPQTSTRSGANTRQKAPQRFTARQAALKALDRAVVAYIKANGGTVASRLNIGVGEIEHHAQIVPDTYTLYIEISGTLPYYARGI